MHVGIESSTDTETRLLSVIKSTTLKVYTETFAFHEIPVSLFPELARLDALAIVRDENGWSQLIPSADTSKELYGIFSLHFPHDINNSGLIGWLATHLKQQFGTGVFVICGYNGLNGGIFDYWGCPAAMAANVFNEIIKLASRA